MPRDWRPENVEGNSEDSYRQKLSFCLLLESHGSLNLFKHPQVEPTYGEGSLKTQV